MRALCEGVGICCESCGVELLVGVGVVSKSSGVMPTYLLRGGELDMRCVGGTVTIGVETTGTSNGRSREYIDVKAKFDIGERSEAETGLCVRGTAGMT